MGHPAAKATAAQLKAAERFVHALTPKWTQYMRVVPHPKQHLFLLLDDAEEILYGGAGGGGKTIALLLAALQYVDVPGYSALLVRRTYPELSKSGALLDKAHELLAGQPGVWWSDRDKSYYFKTTGKPARLQFGYLENERDKFQYGSAEYQFIGFDELTEFEESQYTFLFSRLRKATAIQVPLRMRSASNPGGPGHAWVRARFPVDRSPVPSDPLFIPARIDDNPSIDKESYERSLDHLLPVDRERIKEGRWDVVEGGSIFRMDWLIGPESDPRFLEVAPSNVYARIRWWDMAGTTDQKNSATASVRMAKTTDKLVIIEHAMRGWWTPGARDNIIRAQSEADGRGVRIGIEEEGGSGGIAQNDALVKQLMGRHVLSERPTGDKFDRFAPFASYAERGFARILRGSWNSEYLAYMHALSLKEKKLDWMDATSGAFGYLAALPVPSTAPKQRPPDIDESDWRSKFKGNSQGGPSGDWRSKFSR